MAKHWLVDGDIEHDDVREKAFRRIRTALLAFTARGFFAQVMQQEHHRCYRKWQETFQLDRSYQEVRDEVQELHDYVLMCRTERIEQQGEEQRQRAEEAAHQEAVRERAAQERAKRLEERISLLGVCIGVPAVLIGFLSINLAGITAKDEGLTLWLALLIAVVGGSLCAWFVLWWLRRPPRIDAADPQAK